MVSSNNEVVNRDKYFMNEVLKLARKGEGSVSPNPLVGAVVVNNGEIVGRGFHEYYGGSHAEINALKDAGNKAKGGTLYVNLEPCSHRGKTPPCSLHVKEAGLKRIVIAMKDPNPIVAGRGERYLREAGIEVTRGVLKKEAKRLNEVFIKYITTDYPFVYLKTAQTADGFLATASGESKWITGEEARLEGHQLRNKVDGVLVGSGTVLADNPQLTTRLPDGKGKDSLRIILDTYLKTPLEAKILSDDCEKKTLLVCAKKIYNEKKSKYSEVSNVEISPVPLNDMGLISIDDLLKELHKREIGSILVEGGGRINYSFLEKGFVDRLHMFIAPKLMGGSDGVSVFDGKGPVSMDEVMELYDTEYKILGEDLMLTARVENAYSRVN